MALETVRITEANILDGVVVRVFDSSGTTLVTEGTTGTVDPGVIEFTLPGDLVPIRYQLRFFKIGYRIDQPLYIDIYSPASGSPTGTNNFEFEAFIIGLESAIDSTLCRCSGIVRGPNGRPKRGVDIQFIPKFNPLVVGVNAVLGERVSARTDQNGFVSMDLFRNGLYEVTVQSHENVQREIVVPDRSSVQLAHLLFPVVSEITYSPVGPWTISVDDQLELTPTAMATDFHVLGLAAEDVCYAIENEAIAALQIVGDRIVLRGIAPGATNLRATRRDNSIVYIPDPGIINGSVGIVVTP